jgi:hypothetical protein
MTKHDDTPARVRWARLRFLIIGPLLASPVESGDLAARLDELSGLTYTHPSTGHRVRFARSTIERWYYAAKNEPRDPLRALERKVHARAGSHPSIGLRLAAAIRAQHLAHPRWSCQLHLDNLSRYRTLARPTVRWSSWELSTAELVDGRTGVHLATLLPLDKEKNADALRRVIDAEPDEVQAPAPVGIAPLLREMMSEYAATGLPPAYLALPRKGTP